MNEIKKHFNKCTLFLSVFISSLCTVLFLSAGEMNVISNRQPFIAAGHHSGGRHGGGHHSGHHGSRHHGSHHARHQSHARHSHSNHSLHTSRHTHAQTHINSDVPHFIPEVHHGQPFLNFSEPEDTPVIIHHGQPFLDQAPPQTEPAPPAVLEYNPPPEPSSPPVPPIQLTQEPPKIMKKIFSSKRYPPGRIPIPIQQSIVDACRNKYFDPNEKDPFMIHMNYILWRACINEAVDRYFIQHPATEEEKQQMEQEKPLPIPPPA